MGRRDKLGVGGMAHSTLGSPFGGAGTALAVTERALSAPFGGHLSHRERQAISGANTPPNSYFPANCHTVADEPSTPVLFPENQNAITYIRTMWMTSITSATGI